MKTIRRDAVRHTSRCRDAALQRLRYANRWLIAGSALLTGLFADLAANAFGGHAAGVTRQAARARAATKPLKPPAQAPRATDPQPAPQSSEAQVPSEAPAEERAPSEPAPEAAPETAPETAVEPSEPEVREAEAAPPASEEPVVSGGS